MSLRLLLTNDDGVDAPGMAVLRRIAAALSEDVWVVAPDENQSGAGHRFSFARELSAERRDPQVFAIPTGSPADCVAYAMTHLLADRPADIVLSGINNGQNLGDIIHCSGTAAGAREGALQGAIGIALSQAIDYQAGRSVVWDNAERYGAQVVKAILESRPSADVYFNVNFPTCAPDDVSGVRVVPHQRFAHSPFGHYASDTPGKFFIAIPKTPMPLDRDADFEVLRQDHAITVTPLRLRQTDEVELARLQGLLRL